MDSDLATEEPDLELSETLAEYTRCHWTKKCREDAAYLLVCYKCNTSHMICDAHYDRLDLDYGKAIVFHDNGCKHICLRDNMEILAL